MADVSDQKQFGRWGTVAAWVLLLAFETLAQVALKAGGEGLSDMPFGAAWLGAAIGNPWVLLGALGYFGSFLAWMVILDRLPLSLGFPLTAVALLTVAAASFLVFGETLTLWRIAGIGLIVAGVVIMGRGET
jgi:drug/metabolite transporter (DMT)-like permease